MRSYGLTDTGRARSVNQDYLFISEGQIGKLPNLFVVADGMGGHNAGDRASSLAVEAMFEVIRENKERRPIKALGKGIEVANTTVYRESKISPSFNGMGTTIVAAVLSKDKMYVANVGDSRLYVINDTITQITHDHSLVEEMVMMGEITKEEARLHPDKNIITRAVGVRDTVRTDFFEYRLANDDIVLMCSDGLSNMVSDKEILDIVKRERNLKNAAECLIAAANQNGGKDNITVLLVCKKD